jgi:hypothetical protein
MKRRAGGTATEPRVKASQGQMLAHAIPALHTALELPKMKVHLVNHII